MAALTIVRCAGRWGSGLEVRTPDRPGGGGPGPSSAASPRDLSCFQAGQARGCTPIAKSGRMLPNEELRRDQSVRQLLTVTLLT